jgi:hypothetical protein
LQWQDGVQDEEDNGELQVTHVAQVTDKWQGDDLGMAGEMK